MNLKLNWLRELSYIWKGAKHSVCLQHLYKLQIWRCPKLKVIFSTSVLRSLPLLKFLAVQQCDELEQIIEKDEENEIAANSQCPDICFSRLKLLLVTECDNLKRLLCISRPYEFPELQCLMVAENSRLEEVFEVEQSIREGTEKVSLPELKFVILVKLPNLNNVCQGIELQARTDLLVHDCPNLSLTSTTEAADILKNRFDDKEIDNLVGYHFRKLRSEYQSSPESELPSEDQSSTSDQHNQIESAATESHKFLTPKIENNLTENIEETETTFIGKVPQSVVPTLPASCSGQSLATPIELNLGTSTSTSIETPLHKTPSPDTVTEIVHEASAAEELVKANLSAGGEGLSLGCVGNYRESIGCDIFAHDSQDFEQDDKLNESDTIQNIHKGVDSIKKGSNLTDKGEIGIVSNVNIKITPDTEIGYLVREQYHKHWMATIMEETAIPEDQSSPESEVPSEDQSSTLDEHNQIESAATESHEFLTPKIENKETGNILTSLELKLSLIPSSNLTEDIEETETKCRNSFIGRVPQSMVPTLPTSCSGQSLATPIELNLATSLEMEMGRGGGGTLAPSLTPRTNTHFIPISYACRKESEDMKNVERISRLLLEGTDLPVAEPLVGEKSHVQNVIQLLNRQQSDDVHLLGIWGMVGIGKTTVAKAIYNQICCNFDGSSFLPNIRETWQREWHKSLQEKLLSDIDRTTEIRVSNIESGKNILKDKLCNKRVLLVLDGVNKLEQLKALCGSREWFGPGSIIIITTRDKYLLKEHRVDHVHPMKEMDVNESLELFSWHAFKKATPREDFAVLSGNVVSYSGGLPLALKVLGSELSGKGIKEWERELDARKRTPHPDIQKVLVRSYDDLNDDTEKAIFLDIAFFFVGMHRNNVLQALQGFGPSAETKVSVLVNQSLVTVDEKGNVGMHGLLREMGRQIFRELSLLETGPRIHDVFLSFRGEDTRATFTSHLYTYLKNAGIEVFKDDVDILRGDRVSISLIQAIGKSRISVVVLSSNYANSRWCMVELEKIMECHRTTNQLVVPVFYDVEPSDVRHQTGTFGEAFNDLLKRISAKGDKVQSWGTALNEVGSMSGHVIKNYRDESKSIQKIVEEINRFLDPKYLSVAKHPVGIEARAKEAIELLNKQQVQGVRLLGIWGMPGIGKSALAKSIYNKIGYQFEARSILLNIRENWERNNGQVNLQEQLLLEICGTQQGTITSTDKGKAILEHRLRHKKLLLVLDDVNKLEQLNALAGSHKWFGSGSSIIITTSDVNLVRVDGVKRIIYQLKELDESESVELFSWHAFGQPRPREGLDELSREIVAYCRGLPLALQVLGSRLFDEDINVWKSVLVNLKRCNREIQEKLRISYDGLIDSEEKEIFLDIACFFVGMDRNDVIHILMDRGFNLAEIRISSLVRRSLVTVDNKNKLGMHDLLLNMGREIAREIPKEPEKRRRLCHQKEVIDVLSGCTGTEAIEGLTLKRSKNDPLPFWTRAFEKMTKLRLLQFSGVTLNGEFKYLSRDLVWLNWYGCHLTHTPEDWYQGSLVAIELEYSKLEKPWIDAQSLKKLKILNLSHSHGLSETPNFSYMPNLQKLILEDCPSLSEVSDSIEHLNEILLINLRDCSGLGGLPTSIYKLKSLKTLILSGCSNIKILEEELERMESLTTLMADNTDIKRVVILKNIGYISLCGYKGLSRDVFPSLIWSWMSPKNNLSSLIQTFPSFSYLGSLELHSSSLPGLSYILEVLPNLRSLWLNCDSEQLVQYVESILDILHAIHCKELEATTSTSQVSNSETSASIDYCSQGHIFIPKDSGSLKEDISRIGSGLLPSDNYPDGFTVCGDGSSVNFKVPQENGCDLKTMICVVYYTSSDKLISEGLMNLSIINYSKKTIQIFKPDTLTSTDEEWQRAISNMEPGNRAKVSVVFGKGFTVKRTEVRFIYAGPNDKNISDCRPTDHEPVFDSEYEENESVRPPNKNRGTSITPKPGESPKESRKDQDVQDQDSAVKEPNLSPSTEQVAEFSRGNISEEPHISCSQKYPDTLDLTVEKNARAPDKGKAPMEFNTLDATDDSDEEVRRWVQRPRLECGSELQITGYVALDTLNAENSMELEATSQVSNMNTSASIDCLSQVNIYGSKNSLNPFFIQMGKDCPVTEILKENISQKLTTSGSGDFLLPHDNDCDWFTFNGEGSSVTFEQPQQLVANQNPLTTIVCQQTSTNHKSARVKFDADEITSIAPIFDDNILVDPIVPLEEQRMETETRDDGRQDRIGRTIPDQVSSFPVDQMCVVQTIKVLASPIHSDVIRSSSKTADSMQNSLDLNMDALDRLLDEGDLDMFEDLLTGKVSISSQSSSEPLEKVQSAPIDAWIQDLAGLLQHKFDDFVSNEDYKHQVEVLLDQLDQHKNLLSSKKKEFLLAAQSLSQDLFHRLPLLQTTINQHCQLLQSKDNLLLQTKSMKQKNVQVQANLETTKSKISTLASNISKLESELAKLKEEHAFLLSAKEKHSSENAQIKEACKLLATNIKEILVEEASLAPSFKSAEASKQHMKDAYDKLATTSKDVN